MWETLRSRYNRNNLFEDTEFPAYSRAAPSGAKWKRPPQVTNKPQFVVDGFDRNDLVQGSIGDCWFIAACVGILQSKKCFAKVVPTDQNFDDKYCGE